MNPWPRTVAVGELRQALSCFRPHVDPPPAKFPRASEVVALSNQDGRVLGLQPIEDLLVEREAM
jgi:hypothetical protein